MERPKKIPTRSPFVLVFMLSVPLLTGVLGGCGRDSPPAPDTTPPSVPAGLTATVYATGRVRLDWRPSTDNEGVANYQIRRGSSWLDTAVDTTYTDWRPLLWEATTYSVCAHDISGNESGYCDPVDVHAVLQLSVVEGVWDGECDCTSPIDDFPGVPDDQTIQFQIFPNTGNVWALLTEVRLFGQSVENPGAYMPSQGAMTAEATGTWSGHVLVLQVGQASIPGECELEEGTVTLEFDDWDSAIGEFALEGTMWESGVGWVYAYASGTCTCQKRPGCQPKADLAPVHASPN